MPWNKVTQMEELNRFVILAQTDLFTLTDLCEQFCISRKTGHKHLARYAAESQKGSRVSEKLTWGGQEGAEALLTRYEHQ